MVNQDMIKMQELYNQIQALDLLVKNNKEYIMTLADATKKSEIQKELEEIMQLKFALEKDLKNVIFAMNRETLVNLGTTTNLSTSNIL